MSAELEVERIHWDVIVVGTGIGGATLGYTLARAGKRVLFCEQGHSWLDGEELRGGYAESFFPKPAVPQEEHVEILARAGRWGEILQDCSTERTRAFIPFLGVGSGGSSALYGMVMERFFPADFCPREHHPNDTAASLPERWPISYETLRPYYELAERLYRVRGQGDPLRHGDTFGYFAQPPGSLSAAMQSLWDQFVARGLHPYRLPLACEYIPGCHVCQGYLCRHECKNDSNRMCLMPAVNEYGATLLDRCYVVRLETDHERVKALHCVRDGRSVVLKGDVTVLAAGALATPRIMWNSGSEHHPLGLANEHGLVGCHLMRHYIDLYIVEVSGAGDIAMKELGCNDFYLANGEKLGSIQSFGALPSVEIMFEDWLDDLAHSRIAPMVPLLRGIRLFMRHVLKRKFANSVTLATIVEDLPYSENRLLPPDSHNGPLRIHYSIHQREQTRINAMRHRMMAILKGRRYTLVKQAESNLRLAHACGTCRFGEDPRSSILDSHNRVHGMANLYVVDSSFFPSSSGTNPSLTIAANALRVAEHMSEKQIS